MTGSAGVGAVEVCPVDVVTEAATVGTNAVLHAARVLDRSTVLVELRLTVLAARGVAEAVERLKRTLVAYGWTPEAIEAAIDPARDDVMRRLVDVAEADQAAGGAARTAVRMELGSDPGADA